MTQETQQTPKILIVEDDEEKRRLLKIFLRKTEWQDLEVVDVKTIDDLRTLAQELGDKVIPFYAFIDGHFDNTWKERGIGAKYAEMIDGEVALAIILEETPSLAVTISFSASNSIPNVDIPWGKSEFNGLQSLIEVMSKARDILQAKLGNG